MPLSADSPLGALAAGPVGVRGPRGEVLVLLKRSGSLSAKELAAHLGLSLNAVRHHLKELEIEGYVAHERQPNGVGAPSHAFRLTSAGDALFPTRYGEALTSVLDAVAAEQGRAAAGRLLEAHFASLVERSAASAATQPASERLAAVVRALDAAGYMTEGAVDADGARGELVQHHCALRAVAERYPEMCAAEQRVLAAALGAEVVRTGHQLAGCTACEYTVTFREERR